MNTQAVYITIAMVTIVMFSIVVGFSAFDNNEANQACFAYGDPPDNMSLIELYTTFPTSVGDMCLEYYHYESIATDSKFPSSIRFEASVLADSMAMLIPEAVWNEIK